MIENVLVESQRNIEEVTNFFRSFGLAMTKAPSDGGWTASQCLAHLADAEISLSLRLRMMLTSENYKFANWDEDAFSEIKSDRDPKLSVEIFCALRKSNLEILNSLDTGKWNRIGIKPNGDEITVQGYVEQMTKHVRSHLEQAVRAAQG